MGGVRWRDLALGLRLRLLMLRQESLGSGCHGGSGRGCEASRLKLDPFTLVAVGGGVAIVQSAVMGVLWSFNRVHRGVATWGMVALLQGVALFLYSTRLWTPDPWVSRVIPTGCMAVSCLMLFAGACAFRGRKPRLVWPGITSGLLLAAFAAVVLRTPESRWRPVLVAPLVTIPMLLAARELLRERRHGLRLSAFFCGTLILLLAVTLLVRGLVMPFHANVPDFMEATMVQLVAVVGQMVCGILLTLGAVMMIGQRQLLEIQQTKDALMAARNAAWALERKLIEKRGQRQRQAFLRDLHDGLAGITANIALATSRPAERASVTPTDERLQHIRQLAAEGDQELRLLMDALDRHDTSWPETLADMRLRTLNLLHAREIEGRWLVAGTVPAEPVDDSAAMFSLTRILKESVSNIARHSSARHACVRFCFGTGRVVIRVDDDGVGLLADRPASGGRGMAFMRQRVSELGGRLQVRVGGGTHLCLVLPLPVAFRPTDGVEHKGWPAAMVEAGNWA